MSRVVRACLPAPSEPKMTAIKLPVTTSAVHRPSTGVKASPRMSRDRMAFHTMVTEAKAAARL